jgi:hypothetical protein
LENLFMGARQRVDVLQRKAEAAEFTIHSGLTKKTTYRESFPVQQIDRLRREVGTNAQLQDRIPEFLQLLDDWCQYTGSELVGAAADNREKIVSLSGSLSRGDSRKPGAAFREPAESLAKLLVTSMDTRQIKEDRVSETVTRVVKLAGLSLLVPRVGDAWDPKLHEIRGKKSSVDAQLSGTIAQVVTRGLVGSDHSPILKAQVYVFD